MAIDLDPADYALFWRKPPLRKGMLVAICGFDGTGKTTQVERLQGTLEGRGVTVTRTRQPTDWYRNEPVVKSYLAHGTAADGRLLTLLSAADRRRNIVEVVEPALAAGGTVICDRYVFSTLAFNVERGVDALSIVRYNVDIPKPDLIVFLDLEPKIVLDRIMKRDKGNLAYEERDFSHVTRVRENFLAIAALDPDIVVLDATESADTIERRILELHDAALVD